MENSSDQKPAEQTEAKPENPEKADVELNLEELEKVSGGTSAVGVYQIIPIAPPEGETTTNTGGVFQIEAI